MKERLADIDWEVCEATHGHRRVSRVTINLEVGRASITANAYEAAGSPDGFIVLYSAEHRSIGFKPADSSNTIALLASAPRKSIGGRQIACVALARRMQDDGYRGSISIPLEWHPHGLLWGDLTMATRRKSPAKGGGV